MTDPRALAVRTWDGVEQLIASLDEIDLTRPSRCAGWAVVDVLHHLSFDVVRALTACASPTSAAPTVDAAQYWRAWAEAADPVDQSRGARATRVQASAYRAPADLLAHWRETAPAAGRALLARDGGERVVTQGHVVTVDDLARSLVVEAAVHHLDCLLELPEAPGPSAEALRVARETAEQLLGGPLPTGNDAHRVLQAAGRLPLTPDDRAQLGSAADRFPPLG